MVGDVNLVVELVAPDGTATQLDRDARFTVHRTARRIEGLEALEHELSVTYNGADPVEAGLRLSTELPAHEHPPTWLVPGLFYGENRPDGCRRLFPRYQRGAVDPAEMVSERWSFRADRCATPTVFGWSGGRMAAIAVDEQTDLGPAGIGFEGSRDRVRVWADLTGV